MKLQYILFQLLILALALFLFPVITAADKPTNAVKFVILNPDDSTIGTPVTVTIEAQKSNNQVDESYQNDVTLVTNGSATGAGLVDIVNGVGTIEINDLVAETVTLSLSDTEATGLDVSSTQQVTFDPAEAPQTPSWRQQDFWFRDDDESETVATGYGPHDTGPGIGLLNVEPGSVLRLRFQTKVAQADGAISPRVEFREGTSCEVGEWTALTQDTHPLSLKSSTHFADGDPTTKQLTGGQNFVAGEIFDSTNSAAEVILLKNDSTEHEWSLKVAQDTHLGTGYVFRISNNGTVLDNYIQCPTLVIKTPPPPPGVTTVTFSGKAYPGAKIFIVDKDVRYQRVVSQAIVTNADGSFSTIFSGIMQSDHSFGLLVKDKVGRASQTKFFDVDTARNSLSVKDVIVPPTIGLTSLSTTRGKTAVVEGYASPDSTVVLALDGKIQQAVRTEKDGFYKLNVDTGPLEFGPHNLRAKQVLSVQKKESDFSPLKTLAVSRLLAPKTDLSGDGAVDIRDWSMFLSFWGKRTKGESESDSAEAEVIDFNSDGKVDIADFSIFVRNIRR